MSAGGSPDRREDGYSRRLEAQASKGEMNETTRDAPAGPKQNTTREMARSEPAVAPKSAYHGDALVDLTKAHETHKRRQTNGSLKASTFYMYDRTAHRFADHAQLGKYRRRDLEGATGKRLIVAFLEGVKKKNPQSAKARLAGVESFWKYGLELAW